MSEPRFFAADWPWWEIISLGIAVFATVAALLCWNILRIPRIKFGDPKNGADEDNLVWWQIPVSVERSSWLERDRVTQCRISMTIKGDNETRLPCVWRTINGPVEVMDLIEGDEPRFVPIIARNTIAGELSGDPRSRPYIPLGAGAATLTDLAGMIHRTVSHLEIGRYTIQLHLLVPGKKNAIVDSQLYVLEIPSRTSPNKNFTLR
jgi:hypothetical protein